MLIKTTFYGPTNCKGSRIGAQATDGGPRVTIGYPHELHGDRAHEAAVREYCLRQLDDRPVDIECVGSWPRGYYFIVRNKGE